MQRCFPVGLSALRKLFTDDCFGRLYTMSVASAFSIVLIGSSGVGKSEIVRKLYAAVNPTTEFADSSNAFLEAVHLKAVDVAPGKTVSLTVYDTSGAQKDIGNTVFTVRQHSPHAIVLLFSLVEARSFIALPDWLKRLNEFCFRRIFSRPGSELDRPKIFLLGNKKDLISNAKHDLAVSQAQVDEFLSKNQIIRYFSMTVFEQSTESVLSIFEQIAQELLLLNEQGLPKAKEKPGAALKESVVCAQDSQTMQSGAIRKSSAKSLKQLAQLLERPLEAQDESGRSPLALASIQGNLSILAVRAGLAATSLEKTQSVKNLVNNPDSAGMTPMMLTVANGHVITIAELHQMGADLNITDQLSFSALTHASVRGNAPAVAELLRLKAEPHQVDFCDNTPLIWAARCGHAQVIRELSSTLTELRHWLHRGEYGMDAHQWAVYFGHKECARLIQERVKSLVRSDSSGGQSAAQVLDLLQPHDDALLEQPAIQARWHWYAMQRTSRGYAMIINNIDFANCSNLNRREGAEVDFRENTSSLFQAFVKMGFTPRMYTNVQSGFFNDLMTHNCSVDDYADHDAFLLCISSHGSHGSVYASDGGELKLEDIFEQVRRVPALKGKPKLFIIQSCRTVGIHQPPAGDRCRVSYSQHEDCFYAFSVVEGLRSFRDTQKGGIFAQAMRDVLLDQLTDLRIDEFSQLMPGIVMKVAELTNNSQIPSSSSTLQKLLYFPPLPSCLSLELA